MSTIQAAYRRGLRFVPLSVVLVILGVLVVLPLGMLVWASIVDIVPRPGSTGGSLTAQWYENLIHRGYLHAATNSLLIACGGTALGIFFGGGLAWLGARTDVPGKILVHLAGIVPLFVSSLVGALAWGILASPNQGLLNILLRGIGIDWSLNVYSMWGVIFVFGIYYAPYSFLLVYSALSLMNPELEESARTHGASNFSVMRRITLPLVAPALTGGGLLTFALILENFPVPAVLGTPGGLNTLPSFIYRLMRSAPPKSNQAAAIGVLLMVLLLVVVFVERKLLARRDYTTISGKGFQPRVIALGKWRWPAFGFVAFYIMLAVVLPLFALLEVSLRDQPFIANVGDMFDPSVFSLTDIEETLNYGPFRDSVINTLIVGVGAAVLGGAFCFAMAFMVTRSKVPGRQLIEYLATVPIAVPALVMGMGILWTWFLIPLPLYGTLLLLMIAYIGRFLPQGFTSIGGSIRQVHTDLEESAVVSGATRARASVSITMPLIRSSVVSAALLLLIMSFRELSIAVFLFTTDTRMLSIVIFDFWYGGSLGRAAAASLLYSVILAVIVIVARRWMGVKPTN